MITKLAVAILLSVSAACSDTEDPRLDPCPLAVVIAPKPVPILATGDSIQLHLAACDANASAIWTVANSTVATVRPAQSPAPYLVAKSPGTTTVTAALVTDNNARDAVTVRVE